MKEKTEIILRFILYKVVELIGIGIISIGAYYLGKLILHIWPPGIEVAWFGTWLIGFLGVIIIAIIIFGLISWIMYNWELATEDTKESRRVDNDKKGKK